MHKCISIIIPDLVSSGFPLQSHKTVTQVSDGMSFGSWFHDTSLDDQMLMRMWHHHSLKYSLHIHKVKTAIPHEECRWGTHLPYLGLETIGG